MYNKFTKQNAQYALNILKYSYSSSVSAKYALNFLKCSYSSSVSANSTVSTNNIIGKYKPRGLNIKNAYVGEEISSIDEISIADGQVSFYNSSFYEADRIFTSNAFNQLLFNNNKNASLLPYSLLLNHAISMSHVDETKKVYDIAFKNGLYLTPAYPNDTFRKQFIVKKLKKASNSKDTLVTLQCNLLRLKNNELEKIFQIDKVMLFKDVIPLQDEFLDDENDQHNIELEQSIYYQHLNKIAKQGGILPSSPVLANLSVNELYLHSLQRPIGRSQNMALSSLFRFTHKSIFNLYAVNNQSQSLYVPASLILSNVLSSASRDLFEILYSQINDVRFYNTVSPVDTIGSLSYIHDIKSLDNGLEQINVTHIGIKNCNIIDELNNVQIPIELFSKEASSNLKRSQLDQIVNNIPQLDKKIALICNRTIIRQSMYDSHSNIPLL